MTRPLKKTLALSAIALLTSAQLAHAAGFADFDIDPRFQAKIAKEKAKKNQSEAQNFNFNANTPNPNNAECGSQNIGNVNTNGRIGAAPREVFVFAPNSINLVSGSGCQ
jgi:hypothetical protein